MQTYRFCQCAGHVQGDVSKQQEENEEPKLVSGQRCHIVLAVDVCWRFGHEPVGRGDQRDDDYGGQEHRFLATEPVGYGTENGPRQHGEYGQRGKHYSHQDSRVSPLLGYGRQERRERRGAWKKKF